MEVESVWRCNACKEFNEHKDIKLMNTPLLYNLHYEGICKKCKNRNVNSFLKDAPNPIFGTGKIEIVPIDPISFVNNYDHVSTIRMTKQEIKDIYGFDLK